MSVRRALGALVVVAGALVGAAPAGVARPVGEREIPDPPDGPEVPIEDGSGLRIAPELADVAVRSPANTARAGRLSEARDALSAATAHRRHLELRLSELVTERRLAVVSVEEAKAALGRATERRRQARAALGAARAAERDGEAAVARAEQEVKDMVLAAYTSSGEDDWAALEGPSGTLHSGERQVLSQAVSDDKVAAVEERRRDLTRLRARVAAATEARDRADQVHAEARGGLGRARQRVVAIDEESVANRADQVATAAEMARRQRAVDAAALQAADARVLATVVGTDFPLVALDAYWKAAALAPCDLPWWALAGITRVESRHGTFGGSALGPRGTTVEPIIGIALNGTRNTAAIKDSEGGILDRDPVWDRAVGPMQFIPSTWRRWDVDGNGDGVADPHNLYDVAMAAAGYLCKGSGGDMVTEAGLRRGFFSYNHALFYVEAVLKAAYEYRDALALPAP